MYLMKKDKKKQRNFNFLNQTSEQNKKKSGKNQFLITNQKSLDKDLKKKAENINIIENFFLRNTSPKTFLGPSHFSPTL